MSPVSDNFPTNLSNPTSTQHDETWVQNEVGILTFAAAALRYIEPNVVPRKKGILAQMARLLKALQDYPLPNSIKGWGEVTFDNAGAVLSFEDFYRGRLKKALQKADFFTLISKENRAITHGDFTTNNLLYSPETGRITALLDFNFASISHPAHEFFYSFNNTGGRLHGWLGEETPQGKESELLRQAILTGHFLSLLLASVASANGMGSEVDWVLAQAWEVELQKLDVRRPSSIRGMDNIANVDEVLACLEPWTLGNHDYLRLNDNEGHRMALRHKSERQLVGLLERMGF
ncbi:hypothetical protein GGR51DRAFT_550133 [Nemania sp. FL0031]|nr:hypothetical protein GGR51DRAFT_550133 [Nemania sp. FL0031]